MKRKQGRCRSDDRPSAGDQVQWRRPCQPLDLLDDSRSCGKRGRRSSARRTRLRRSKAEFGSFETFVEKLSAASVAVQGSGWGWLGFNKANGNSSSPLAPTRTRSARWGMSPCSASTFGSMLIICSTRMCAQIMLKIFGKSSIGRTSKKDSPGEKIVVNILISY